jgi:cardiolipin synthase A/B
MINNPNYDNNNEKAVLVHSGNDYFSRLEQLIQNAQYEIHFQCYIFDYDTSGKKIIEALKNAAMRHVKVYLLLDAFGSMAFPDTVIDELTATGIHFRFFSPFFSFNSFYIGRRLHHKIVVLDAQLILIGGINIAEKYQGTAQDTPWLDYAVLIQEETVAKMLQWVCRNLFFKNRHLSRHKMIAVFYTPEENSIRIIQNDWLKRKNEIYKAYLNAFAQAKNEIIIVGCYFLPGRRLSKALKKAAQNKVNIKLILSGISDIKLSQRATYHIYNKLLRNNIELYEYQNSVLHGKAAVVDGHWTTIGSFNLNNLSAFGSLEMNVEIKSTAFSTAYSNHLYGIIEQCQKITPESIKKRNTIYSHFVNWLSYWTAKFLLTLVTYFPFKRFRNFF